MNVLAERPSLQELTADAILDTLDHARSNTPAERAGLCVLVVDQYVMSMLDACIGVSRLMNSGFLVVDTFETKEELSKELRRRSYPDLDVMYYFVMHPDSLALIYLDYELNTVAHKPDCFDRLLPCLFKGISTAPPPPPPLYQQARAVVVSQLPQPVSSMVRKECARNVDRFRRLREAFDFEQPVQECPVEYHAWEANLFSLEQFHTLSTLYSSRLRSDFRLTRERADAATEDLVVQMARRLVSVCITLGEFPNVRFSRSHRSKRRTERVAREVVQGLRAYKQEYREFATGEDIPEPATLIIVDRVDDLAPAMLHDISYASLVIDVLEHDPCTPYVYETVDKRGAPVEREVKLDDKDPVYNRIRHMELPKVSVTIEREVAERQRAAKAAKKATGIKGARIAMARLVNNEPFVDSKYMQHVDMAHEIFTALTKRNLIPALSLEQQMVTGISEHGAKVSSSHIVAKMRELLDTGNSATYLPHKQDQLRLLLLLVLTQPKLDRSTLQDLVEASRIGDQGKVILGNLTHLNIPRGAKLSESAPRFATDKNKQRAAQCLADGLKGRYISKLEEAVQGAIDGTLSEDLYPFAFRHSGGGGAGGYGGDDGVVPHGRGVGSVLHPMWAEPKDAPETSGAQSMRSRPTKRTGGDAGAGVSSAGGAAAAAHAGDDAGAPRLFQNGRVLVFVVGGITQAEMTALDKLSTASRRELICGGTSVLTPQDFLMELHNTDPADDDSDDAASVPGYDDGDDGAGTGALAAPTAGAGAALDSDEDDPVAEPHWSRVKPGDIDVDL